MPIAMSKPDGGEGYANLVVRATCHDAGMDKPTTQIASDAIEPGVGDAEAQPPCETVRVIGAGSDEPVLHKHICPLIPTSRRRWIG